MPLPSWLCTQLLLPGRACTNSDIQGSPHASLGRFAQAVGSPPKKGTAPSWPLPHHARNWGYPASGASVLVPDPPLNGCVVSGKLLSLPGPTDYWPTITVLRLRIVPAIVTVSDSFSESSCPLGKPRWNL